MLIAARELAICGQGSRAPDRSRAAVHEDDDPHRLGDVFLRGLFGRGTPPVRGDAAVTFARSGWEQFRRACLTFVLEFRSHRRVDRARVGSQVAEPGQEQTMAWPAEPQLSDPFGVRSAMTRVVVTAFTIAGLLVAASAANAATAAIEQWDCDRSGCNYFAVFNAGAGETISCDCQPRSS
jgi:hypothetical protein